MQNLTNINQFSHVNLCSSWYLWI